MTTTDGEEAVGAVHLGDFVFHPLDLSDFRLSVEGASKTGKSNTIAVFLEDLADSPIPTLIIERLGILSSVRTADEHIVTVGGRDEPGIDLTIPLQQLSMVDSLVMDQGMKVLLDISTYDREGGGHRAHHAAAKRREETERLMQKL